MDREALETPFLHLPGVAHAKANPLTGTVLVFYNVAVTDADRLCAVGATVEADAWRTADKGRTGNGRRPIDVAARSSDVRVRPASGASGNRRREAGQGAARGDAHAGANQPHRGDPHAEILVELVASIAGLAYWGGIALFGARPSSPRLLRVAGAITVLQGIPAVDDALSRRLGPTTAEVVLTLPKVVVFTMGGSLLGLSVAAVEALRLYLSFRDRDAAVATLDRGESERREAAPAEAPVRPAFVQQREATSTTAAADRRDAMPDAQARYLGGITAIAAGVAAVAAFRMKSADSALAAMLLLSPRPALAGRSADRARAEARLARFGIRVVSDAGDRHLHAPDAIVFDSPRLLSGGVERVDIIPLEPGVDRQRALAIAAGVARAAGWPVADAFHDVEPAPAEEGIRHARSAEARVDGSRFRLEIDETGKALPHQIRARQRDGPVLVLLAAESDREIAAITLRPRLSHSVARLVERCARSGIELVVRMPDSAPADQRVAELAGARLASGRPEDIVRASRNAGRRTAYVTAHGAADLAIRHADLAVLLHAETLGPPGNADVVVDDIGAIAELLETAERYTVRRRNALAIASLTNVAGLVWLLRDPPSAVRAARLLNTAVLSSLAATWLRESDNHSHATAGVPLRDPKPERWARLSVAEVLSALDTTVEGLSQERAAERLRGTEAVHPDHPLQDALIDNLRSPLTAFVGAAGALALMHGARADAAVMGVTLLANILIGTWQEFDVGRVTTSLSDMGAPTARVLRGGKVVETAAADVVTGDVVLLMPGDRVTADARIIDTFGLAVDEATLTGESLPVRKRPTGGAESNRIVLEGTDVVVGHGTAVVFAVGRNTRLGATVATIHKVPSRGSPLNSRLGQLFRAVLPVTVASSAIATIANLARGEALVPTIVTGASIALAALPEALPILAGMGQAAAGRRLSRRNVVVRRHSAVEALGRVDVACVDKTGTLTEGRLSARVIAGLEDVAQLPADLPPHLRRILLAGALASPHPDARDAASHATDASVIRAALEAGMGESLRSVRRAEARFDSLRSYHAAIVDGRMCIKGAPEVVLARCTTVVDREGVHQLSSARRTALQAQAQELTERGLRVIMVAEGADSGSVDDPRDLTALGFIGMSDPLRRGVPSAVERCRAAGIRVIMLTGDHPATAQAIAHEAGLIGPDDGAPVPTGTAIAEMDTQELDELLDRTTVIARATPIDKLRIIEGLHRRGRTVAMTGDGVNDAPALRLADVGIAMGRGTQVAKQAADVVLTEDDFESLVDALIEGRSFWRNLRRALGLLLGGNLGELAFMVSGVVIGGGASLTVRQVLATNLITDALPAFAVAVQAPEHRRLSGLSREGTASLERPLRHEILYRAVATAGPAFGAFLIGRLTGSVERARSTGFATIVSTQLALTIDAGRTEGGLTRPVVAGVAGSTVALLALLTIPPLRTLFQLSSPGPIGWALMAGGTVMAPLIPRFTSPDLERQALVSAGAGVRPRRLSTGHPPAGELSPPRQPRPADR